MTIVGVAVDDEDDDDFAVAASVVCCGCMEHMLLTTKLPDLC